MSSLLTLAKDLKQKSKAQQPSTGEMLKAAFSEHEQSVRAENNASAKRISAAISAHEHQSHRHGYSEPERNSRDQKPRFFSCASASVRRLISACN